MQATEVADAHRTDPRFTGAEAECSICQQVITQPLCVACLEREMEAWMRETRPDLIDDLRAKADELYVPRGSMKCVQCDNPMDVCAYCFTEHILNWLSKHPSLIPEFVMYFNFDLHYHGYGEKLLELV